MLTDEPSTREPTPIKPRFIFFALACGLSLAPGAMAESIPFRLVDGKPCSRCNLVGARSSIPTNVVFEFGMESAIFVHSRAAEVIGVSPQTGVTLEFNGLHLPQLQADVGESEALERLTQEHAPELDEIPATAFVGLRAFGEFTLQVDFTAGLIRLLPAGENAIANGSPLEAGDASGGTALPNGALIPFEIRDGRLCLQAEGPDEFPLTALLSTLQYDTLLDTTTAALLDAPGGELDVLRIGALNVAEEVALRPEDLSSGSTTQRDVVLGTGFLSSFRMTVDLRHHRLLLERLRQPRFPTEERAYFVAREAGDADAIERFLQEHSSSRLAGEASARLIRLRLEDEPRDTAAVRKAMRLRTQCVAESNRARVMVALADHLMESTERRDRELAAEALRLGLEYTGQDPDARAVHDIHARLGRIALLDGDLKQARRHLLSAAFGLPRDPNVNLWLGQVYEQSGKLSRAWSRYLQAALASDPPPEAWECLDRLNRDPAFRAEFSMKDAADLLEGRAVEFHPPGRFLRDQARARPGVRLAELFTCVDHEATLAAELAFGGLQEYLEGTDAVFVAYHLPYPESEPLVSDVALSRARLYGVNATPRAVFDGADVVDLGGDEGATNDVFGAYQARCEPAGPDRETAWQVVGEATLKNGLIDGKATVLGPGGEKNLRLFLILCEDLVMVPGGNSLLLHHNVARATISPEDGYDVPAESGPRDCQFSISLSEVTAHLERQVAQMEQAGGFKFHMRPTYVDGRGCFVAGILQDRGTKRVLAAVRIDVVPGKENAR